MDEAAGRERPTRHAGRNRINLTDRDAKVMRTRQGFMPSYNAQAIVSPLGPEGETTCMLVTAVEVVNQVNIAPQLTLIVKRAEQVTVARMPMPLADAGYFAGKHVAEIHQRGQQVVVPNVAHPTDHLYHKDQFN